MSDYIVIHGIKVHKDYANFVPETFGRLTTLGPKFLLTQNSGSRHAYQVCQCSCGTVKVTSFNKLRKGEAKSCGCLISDTVIARCTTHGEGGRDGGSVEHRAWCNMKNRCYNEKLKEYPNYGGRGIGVCDRWRDPINGYANFLADMGRRPPQCESIDRYPNPNGNYEPGNCRWADRKQQNRNKRNNRPITFGGRTQLLIEWAEELGIHASTLLDRFKEGWTLERALTTPKIDKYSKRPRRK